MAEFPPFLENVHTGASWYSERQKKLRGLIATDWPDAQVTDAWSCKCFQHPGSFYISVSSKDKTRLEIFKSFGLPETRT